MMNDKIPLPVIETGHPGFVMMNDSEEFSSKYRTYIPSVEDSSVQTGLG